MKLGDATIGYDGYSADFSRPGDRRRFCAYASHRGLMFDRARLDRDYDLVVVTHNGDIAGWTERKRRDPAGFKLVFELADSYFTQTRLARRLLKGAGRYVLGFDSRLSLDFLKTLERACASADAVICTTEEQKRQIARFNPNAFVTFDWFGDELGPPKKDYRRSGKLKLVWEGQSSNLRNLRILAPVLRVLRERVELHVVTDPLVPRYFGRIGSFSSSEILNELRIDAIFHPWEPGSFSRLITDCDAAVIPIDRADPFACGKPENKLIMFWQLGMPVLASPTPAYGRAMRAAGIEMTCDEADGWQRKIIELSDQKLAARRAVGKKAMAFAVSNYSIDSFLAGFDRTFEHVGYSI